MNSRFKIQAMAAMFVVLVSTASCSSKQAHTITWEDGHNNDLILQLFKEDIAAVEAMTQSKHYAIWYSFVDLNDDGRKDLVTIIASPLHSGSAGNTFEVWFNEDGQYIRNEGSLHAPFIDHLGSEPSSRITIRLSSSDSTDYKDIIFEDEDHQWMLRYNGSAYLVYSEPQ